MTWGFPIIGPNSNSQPRFKPNLRETSSTAKKDKRLKMKGPEQAAQVFHGLLEGTINFPALYSPLKTAKELKPIKDEVIAAFLSRYGG